MPIFECTHLIVSQLEHAIRVLKLIQASTERIEKEYGLVDNLTSLSLEDLKNILMGIIDNML